MNSNDNRDNFIIFHEDETAYRVKIPAWKEEVGTVPQTHFNNAFVPAYMSNEGWGCDTINKVIWLDLGVLGRFYFNHGTASDNTANPAKYLASSIEYCSPQQNPGEGTIKWRFNYDYDANGIARLKYIFNGSDPNQPENSGNYYKYVWSDNYTKVEQKYYNTDIDANNPLRVWNAAFDSKGRAVESWMGSGCSGGCGGDNGGYEKLEYFEDPVFDDLIKKKFNADGDVILENEYAVYQYDISTSELEINIDNDSFEMPDVNDGSFQVGLPSGWKQTDADPNLVRVYDPSTSQWSTRYNTGETIPNGSQVLTLLGGGIQQDTGMFVTNGTSYLLETEVGAFNDAGNSEATIKLVAVDIYDVNEINTPVELTVMNVREDSDPEGTGVRLVEGEWVTEADLYTYPDDPGTLGYKLRIIVEGNLVDVDQVRLTAITSSSNSTSPLLVSQIADPNSPNDPNVLFVTWEYDTDTKTAIERRWVDNGYARVIKYLYKDGGFSTLLSKTEYEQLNDNPGQPSGNAYTTSYQSVFDAGQRYYYTTYPSGKRKDVEEYENGLLKKSYKYDIDSGNTSDMNRYTYADSYVVSHTDPRGGLTSYSYYNNNLMKKQEDPQTTTGQQVTEYGYDDARRMIWEKHKDTNSDWIKTTYSYNPTTGFLDKIIADDDYGIPPFGHVGLKQTTEYKYNDFGQMTRQKDPDGTVSGKSYGLGGELVSEFVLADPNDIEQVEPNLISQTRYYYDDDGRIEFIKKVKHDREFEFGDPDNINNTLLWVTTKYEYDFLGRKTAVIEDNDGMALRTTYEYNNQNEIVKTTLPNGKWTETYRDGRGLVIIQVVGHDNMNSDDWLVTEFSYDANKNLVNQLSPDGTSTIYEYDNLDRLIKVKKGVRE